jgi:CubicO group peptidase (beta-lactamase class C family)
LKLIDSGVLKLTETLDMFFVIPIGTDTARTGKITVKQLMTHTSGIPAHVMLSDMASDPGDVYDTILKLPLLDDPGKNVVYSCLGYILLGKICEMLGGAGIGDLARDMVFKPLGMTSTQYNPDQGYNNFAATEYNAELGGHLKGVVHDENARFQGGVSGNAGIFSTIGDCSRFAFMLANYGEGVLGESLFKDAVSNHSAHCEEGRGLGFVVKAPGSVYSCGNIFSDGSYGHTGFTGTSIWVDAETSQYVVLLSNRVHPTRENTGMISFRKAFHDTCAEAYRKDV